MKNCWWGRYLQVWQNKIGFLLNLRYYHLECIASITTQMTFQCSLSNDIWVAPKKNKIKSSAITSWECFAVASWEGIFYLCLKEDHWCVLCLIIVCVEAARVAISSRFFFPNWMVAKNFAETWCFGISAALSIGSFLDVWLKLAHIPYRKQKSFQTLLGVLGPCKTVHGVYHTSLHFGTNA